MGEREYLNLPLKYGDIREDGAKFISYYYNINTNTNYKSRPLEQWIFKENIEKQKQTKAEHKRKTATANRNFIRRLKKALWLFYMWLQEIFRCSLLSSYT